MMEINVTIPKLSTLKRIERELPETLLDKKLVKNFALLKAALTAYSHNCLPSEYYVGILDPSATGKVPKDVMVLCNLDFCISEYRREMERRSLMDQFQISISIQSK